MEINQVDFKLIDKIEPPVAMGKYTVTAAQTVRQKNTAVAAYEASQDYIITHRAYTLDTGDVFSVYPANGASGNFAETLPYITFKDRCMPWIFGAVPFLALIVLKDDEILSERELTVNELFTTAAGTYFPEKPAFPAITADEGTDTCRVIEISTDTYTTIFPGATDIPLLAHAKYIDLSQSADDVCPLDGYFSVVIANRFVPSCETEETVSTCHLVTVFGYGEAIPKGYDKVKLVSLYKWSVRSKSAGGRPYTELIAGLKENSGVIGCRNAGQAAAVKLHYTRTGETTYSLYRSPFIPYHSSKIPQLKAARTADGRLIYNQENGVFDVSYAAAFQLGRLITLEKPEIAAKVLAHRNDIKMQNHKIALGNRNEINIRQIGNSLLEHEKAISAKCRR